MLIMKIIGIAVMLDVTITLMFSPLGVMSTCSRCNKKFDGTFMWNIWKQTTHRCEDNLVQ